MGTRKRQPSSDSRGSFVATLWRAMPIAWLFLCSAFLPAYSAEATQAERGVRIFQRRCAMCHMGGASSYALPLSKFLLQGREDAVRTLISEGGVKMPGFKHVLRPEQIEEVLAYLRSLESPPTVIGAQRVEP